MTSTAAPRPRRTKSANFHGERGAAAATLESREGETAARIEIAAGKVADLDRQIGQIDTAIETAAKKGKTQTALSAMVGQKNAHAGLVEAKNRGAATLAALKAERAQVAAKGRQIETEATPIRYVAELLGVATDSEKAIRWLILADGADVRPAGHRLDGRGLRKTRLGRQVDRR